MGFPANEASRTREAERFVEEIKVDTDGPAISELVRLGYFRVSTNCHWQPGCPWKCNCVARDSSGRTLMGWGRSPGEALRDLLRRGGVVVPEPGPAPVPAPRRARRPRAGLVNRGSNLP